MSRLNPQPFEVKVGDQEYLLRPTLKAYDAIESRFGGLRGAHESLSQLSVTAATVILAAGADIKAKDTADLREAIFDAGIASVVQQLQPFVAALFNPRGAAQDADEGKTQAG